VAKDAAQKRYDNAKEKNMWGCGFGYSLDLSTIP
jgi:hypothetical protein